MKYTHQLRYISLLTLAGSVAGNILSVGMVGPKLGPTAIHGESGMVIMIGLFLYFCAGLLSLMSVGAAHLAKKESAALRIPWLPISWLMLGLFLAGTTAVFITIALQN